MKNRYTLQKWAFGFCFLFSVFSFNVFGQVGIGTTDPNPNALLDIDASTTPGGLLLPRVNLTATNLSAPLASNVPGMVVYNTAVAGVAPNAVTPGYYYNDGSQWVRLAADAPSDDWSRSGNAGTTPGTNFLGTTDGQAVQFRTNNTTRLTIPNANQIYANSLGTQALPFYSFAEDQNTGVWSSAADNLNFSTNGGQRFQISNSFIRSFQNHRFADGNAANPSITFNNSQNMGMYRIGANILGFSTNGTERARIAANGNVGIGTTNPSEKLHVDGNLRMDGAFMPGNQAGAIDKILLSKGPGTAPAWGPGFLNTTSISNIGKFFTPPFNIPALTFFTLTVTDANMTADTTVEYNFVGPLPSGPQYGNNVRLFAEPRDGSVIFYITNSTLYNLNNFEIVYTAFYN